MADVSDTPEGVTGIPSAPETGNDLRAAAERMVQTFRDWLAGCDNGTRWEQVEAAHINLRDALRHQSNRDAFEEWTGTPEGSMALTVAVRCDSYTEATRALRAAFEAGERHQVGKLDYEAMSDAFDAWTQERPAGSGPIRPFDAFMAGARFGHVAGKKS